MKDTLCSYYTNSEEITSYMTKKLGIKQDDIILEPAAGEGIFIDEILKMNIPVQIDALDINDQAISVLERKYRGNSYVSVRKTDTLLDERLDSFTTPEIWVKETDTLIDEQLDYFEVIGGHYDKVIGNPPYGAWQDYDKRDLLKKKYPGQYVKETYSLFLLRCLSVLKMGGRLSFIIPDTFMFLNMHSKLREILLTRTKIEEIITFPSSFFPGVSFGYSGLSIITLERTTKEVALNNSIRIVQGFQSPSEFQYLYKHDKLPEHLQTTYLRQENILNNEEHRFIIADKTISNIINNTKISLSDVADVVTGFYTGDNKRFIRVLNNQVKGGKNYESVDLELVFPCTSLDGIENVSEGYIPYVKSASKTRYFRTDIEWFVRWDKQTINFYKSNRKSRFQNSSFYFQTGVAIPMVKASSIKAFLIEGEVFDQSIVGIFPKDPSKIYYILALMNSDVVNELIHVINPTANNSANYVKKIPYIEPKNEIMEDIKSKVKMIEKYTKQNELKKAETLHNEINIIIRQVYGM